jgi:iron complex transport system substrate-binding protein
MRGVFIMKRIIRRNKSLKLATCLLSLLLLAGCGSASADNGVTGEVRSGSAVTSVAEEAKTVELTDHMDRQVTVPTNPQNVVILDILPLPSVLTIYLGSAKTIKAMEPASMNAAKNSVLGDLFPEIQDVSTDIMSNEDVNIESLMAMNPDVVFFNAGNKELCEKLENAGLTCVGVSPVKWNYDCIRTYNEWIALLDQIYPDRAAGN